MTYRLSGKNILITGAAQGIGLAIAKTCLREGANLFLVDLDGDLLSTSVAGLEAPAGTVSHATVDIRDPKAIGKPLAGQAWTLASSMP